VEKLDIVGSPRFEQVSASQIPAFRDMKPGLSLYKINSIPSRSLELNTVPLKSYQSTLKHKIQPQHKIKWNRLAMIGLGGTGLAYYAFNRFDRFFGQRSHAFKIQNDFTRDNALLFDEFLHLQGNYHITQGLAGFFRWAGMESSTAEWTSAGTTATIMTILEYIDGFRPNSGASYSDFIANYVGVGLALAKMKIRQVENFDISFSYQTITDISQKHTLLNYNRMTHWLIYRSPKKLDIMNKILPSKNKTFSWLGVYRMGLQVQIF
jgi:hypothetical protein